MVELFVGKCLKDPVLPPSAYNKTINQIVARVWLSTQCLHFFNTVIGKLYIRCLFYSWFEKGNIVTAGYSVGELAALVLSKALTFEEGNKEWIIS